MRPIYVVLNTKIKQNYLNYKQNYNFSTTRINLLPKYKIAKLPSLSPTMESGTVVSWIKNEGDFLDEGELLAEIETDKATMSMETPVVGYLAKILKKAGSENVLINEVILNLIIKI